MLHSESPKRLKIFGSRLQGKYLVFFHHQKHLFFRRGSSGVTNIIRPELKVVSHSVIRRQHHRQARFGHVYF